MEKEYRLNKVLRDLLKENGLNQKELAEEINVSPLAVSNWLHYKSVPSLVLAIDTANYFGISLDYLVYGIEE